MELSVHASGFVRREIAVCGRDRGGQRGLQQAVDEPVELGRIAGEDAGADRQRHGEGLEDIAIAHLADEPDLAVQGREQCVEEVGDGHRRNRLIMQGEFEIELVSRRRRRAVGEMFCHVAVPFPKSHGRLAPLSAVSAPMAEEHSDIDPA